MNAVLSLVPLVDVTRGDLVAAATHALRLGAGEVLTYDAELASASAATGIRVVTPGQCGV